MNENVIWISKEILHWDIFPREGRYTNYESYIRSYKIWEHSQELIINSKNNFDLTDGISNLKRSINQRLRLIEDIYNFKSIEFPDKPKGYLELLECFGLVRPFILKNLISIRNDIEHHDAMPPAKERCKEMVDIVWYFLKSTDEVVKTIKDYVDFGCRDENRDYMHFGFSLNLNMKEYNRTAIGGRFPSDLIYNQETKNCVKINIMAICSDYIWIKANSYRKIRKTDECIQGEIMLEGNDLYCLLKKIFSEY